MTMHWPALRLTVPMLVSAAGWSAFALYWSAAAKSSSAARSKECRSSRLFHELLINAALFLIWARRHLGVHWSGEITIKFDHRLIRSGPYRRIRHPIYTAMIGMMAGSAITSGEMHALLGFAIAGLAYARKIRMEEANLRRAFGAAYEGYRRETGALIPKRL
jgi:protein-S-isoprenylcysteine O-methyltransferase Ste14